MQRDDVGAAPDLVERDVFDADRAAIRAGNDVVREHAAAETEQNSRDECADSSRADDADGAIDQVETEEAVQREVAFADARVRAMDLAIERQDERHRVLGHCMRGVGGHARYRYAQLSRPVHVDVVEPCGPERDESRASRGERRQYVRVELVVDEGAHDREAGGERARRQGQTRLEIVEDVAVLRVGVVKRLPIEGMGTVERDTHGDLPTGQRLSAATPGQVR